MKDSLPNQLGNQLFALETNFHTLINRLNNGSNVNDEPELIAAIYNNFEKSKKLISKLKKNDIL